MNLVKMGLGFIERQASHRGSFTSGSGLVKKIRAFINGAEPAPGSLRLDENRRPDPDYSTPSRHVTPAAVAPCQDYPADRADRFPGRPCEQ